MLYRCDKIEYEELWVEYNRLLIDEPYLEERFCKEKSIVALRTQSKNTPKRPDVIQD